ncbi:Fc.00g003330.m01.CDS01 [Cosmosporella sp. VM-42]
MGFKQLLETRPDGGNLAEAILAPVMVWLIWCLVHLSGVEASFGPGQHEDWEGVLKYKLEEHNLDAMLKVQNVKTALIRADFRHPLAEDNVVEIQRPGQDPRPVARIPLPPGRSPEQELRFAVADRTLSLMTFLAMVEDHGGKAFFDVQLEATRAVLLGNNGP